MFSKFTKVKLDEYPGLVFYPFHQLKKLNGGVEPYIKSINVGHTSYDFFKVNGEVYGIKPSSKNDMSKLLCAKVENPITLESAQGSITGNCAKGVKQQFVRFCKELQKENLTEEEFFIRLIKSY